MILYVFFVSGTLRAVEIELEIVRGSQAAHLKDGIVIFQNLQKNRKFVERESFYDPRLFKKKNKNIANINDFTRPHNKKNIQII